MRKLTSWLRAKHRSLVCHADDAGGSSAKSSLIHISLERPRREEERDEEVEEDQVPEMRGLAHTMPTHTGHIRMVSVPRPAPCHNVAMPPTMLLSCS